MDYNITRHTNFIMKFDIFLIKRWFKHQYQTLTRGFSDKETWSLDWTIAKFVLPRLKRFKKLNNGFPHGMTEQSWEKALDDMIYSMEIYSKGLWSHNPDEVNWKRVKRGTTLFGKHFRDLWW